MNRIQTAGLAYQKPVFTGNGVEIRATRLEPFPGTNLGKGVVVKGNQPHSAARPITVEPLSFSPPPAISLNTHHSHEVLCLLDYAGVRYLSLDSPAAEWGVKIFNAGRTFAKKTNLRWVGADFDFTIDGYQIYSNPLKVIGTRFLNRRSPNPDSGYIRALETAKPGMHELLLGMMIGFAERQGLQTFDQWENYIPQVRIVTHTWPDRVMHLANENIPILSLMTSRLPGQILSIDEVKDSDAVITLHHFLKYADDQLAQFEKNGFQKLSSEEQDELMVWFRTGKAHYLKPRGALIAEKGWEIGSWMMVDDSETVVNYYRQKMMRESVVAVHAYNPLTPAGKEVPETAKLTIGKTRAAKKLAMLESKFTGPSMIRFLEELQTNSGTTFKPKIEDVPQGTILTLQDTVTTLKKFYDYYVEPTRRLKNCIREVLKDAGGLRQVEARYKQAVEMRTPACS